jgi:hypothetical protein
MEIRSFDGDTEKASQWHTIDVFRDILNKRIVIRVHIPSLSTASEKACQQFIQRLADKQVCPQDGLFLDPENKSESYHFSKQSNE